MGGLGPLELGIILVIVIIIFGVGRIGRLARVLDAPVLGARTQDAPVRFVERSSEYWLPA